MAIKAPPVELAKIYVANSGINRGDEVAIEMLRQVDWPADYLPLGAITSPEDIIQPDGTLPVSLGVIVPGEPILRNKLSVSQVRDSLVQLIEPGYRAVSVAVDDATGVAGFILPDHRVDVNSYREVANDDGRLIQRGDLLLRDIRVLAIDQSFTDGQDGARLASTVTLQVTPDDARRLGIAIEAGEIGLALRGEDEPAVAVRVPIHSALPRATVRRSPAPARPAFTDIRIVAGETEETVTTPVARPTGQTGAQK